MSACFDIRIHIAAESLLIPEISTLPPTPSTFRSTFVSDDYNPLTANSMSNISIGTSTAYVPIRRSARLSVASASAASEDNVKEEDIRPPLAKRKRGRPRKTPAPAHAATQVKLEAAEEVDVKQDITTLAPGNGVYQETQTASTAPVKRKRGRPSKASLLAAAAAAVSSSNEAVKVEITQTIESEKATGSGLSGVRTEEVIRAVTVDRPSAAASSSQPLPAKVKGKAKGKEKAPVDPKKERLARVRAKCPKNILDRYKRAISQRMFMLEREKIGSDSLLAERFKVLGSTGNVYTINIGARPQCDCPDCRKGNMPCKHIIFLFVKVLKVPDDSTIWYQKYLTTEELEAVFTHAPPSPNGAVSVSFKVRDAYLRATGVFGDEPAEEAEEDLIGPGSKRMSAIGEDCPVCYDEMTEDDVKDKKLVFDEALGGCGKPLHKQCFEMWALTARNKGDQVTCVWCRTPWPGQEMNGKGKGKGPEYTATGYLNMADVAGMSRERDVSTYHRGYRYLGADF